MLRFFIYFFFACADETAGRYGSKPTVIAFYKEFNQGKALGDTKFDSPTTGEAVCGVPGHQLSASWESWPCSLRDIWVKFRTPNGVCQ
ncbi:hypothetical protein ACL7TT_06420 [Microbulbifer sp. 2304DJ12-6]|uniref:hypothetical protein n=1 Tax=Microbulbifer sp. 2304DJ12-6 TaxID=3233340 RepID=UPI0039B08C01